MLDLSRLSWTQRQVVLAGDGAQLVLAGPGSGKTTVLTARIAYLVASGRVPASSVLALTFARRATRELRLRLAALLGDVARGLEVATFHAFGLRIIRLWSAELGLGDGPLVIYDADDAQGALRAAATEMDLNLTGWSATELSALVERCRLGRTAPTSPAWLDQLVQAYEALLRRRRAVDYAGMLALPLQLFRHSARALRVVQDAYRHIACDEFQDLCGAQYALLRLLAAPHRNVVVVGDPCQSLYGWRGADPRLTRAFARDFPEARLHQLTESFRSTAQVVQLANALGAPLTDRGPLTTCNAAGPRPRLQVAHDERAEARFVAAEIARLWRERYIAGPAEVAVLYRSNHQATALALALRQQQLPYRVRGGDLFARAAVRVAVAYLRLAHNPADGAALAYIVNTPPRRLGKLALLLADTPVTLADLPAVAQRLGPAALASAEALVTLVQEFGRQAASLRPAALLELVLHRSGYYSWLIQQREGTVQLGHIGQLRALAAEAQEELGTWLADLQLGDAPDAVVEAGAAVTLSTIHAAKGGEWRVVFVVGLEEGLLPHYLALDARAGREAAAQDGEGDAIAGELRVAYVAVTRARERLYLTYCRSRRRGTQTEPRAPSRFLSALPVELLGPGGLSQQGSRLAAPMLTRIGIALIKRAHAVADVIARYGVELRPSGRALVGRCPFHPDGGRPNLHVYPATQSWYCYRCALGGDVIRFVERIEGLSFRGAVARLQDERPTLTMPRIPPCAHPRVPPNRRAGRPRTRGPDERACLAAAVTLYHQHLLAEPTALAYLERRGLERATIVRHRLGYVAGDTLSDHLRWRRISVAAAVRVGLLHPGGRERLANRVVVPELRDGQPIWLVGRTIPPAAAGPRYLGLPGRKPLLGWGALAVRQEVVLVEGIFDWLVLSQWGVPSLALVGTHVRPDLLAALVRFQRLYLVMDNDAAGHTATEALVRALGPRALPVELSGVKDVADLALEPGGRARFARALSAAAPARAA